MKKSFMLSAMLLSAGTCVFAQRNVDLGVTLTSPAANATITSGQTFTLSVSVKNIGANPIKATDTVAVFFYIDNQSNLLKDGSNNPIGFATVNRALNTGDTVNNSMNLTMTHSLTGNHQLCAIAVPINRSADSVKDNVTANNVNCATLKFVSGTTAIGTVTASVSLHQVSPAYPNPANDFCSFKLDMGERAAVAITLTDMAGRVVLREDKGNLLKGEHELRLHTGNLPRGIYLYEVSAGNERSRGKLSLR